MKEVLLVAHRGESHDAPENTLAAFNLAWERKCRAIELDVHLSADGQVVVIHDFDTMRVSGKKLVVADSVYNELAGCDVGSFKSEKYRNERIPLLSQALATIPVECRVLVEIKCKAEILPMLARVVENSGLGKEQVELICFDADVLAKAGEFLPGYRRLLLSSIKTGEKDKAEELSEICRERKFNGVDLYLEGTGTDLDRSVARIKEQGLLVYTWTVDDPESARAQARAGVDAITSNRAAWLAGQL